MKTKKTASTISESILLELDKGPRTITEIREVLGSNWQTIEKFLKALQEEQKVKELVSTDKKKIYQKITGDTYFDIPLNNEERKKFRTLFFLIKQSYTKKNLPLSKTHFAKTAVQVIKQSEELSDLPTIWYLYGMIPLMVADPTQSYSEEFNFKNKKDIENLIEIYVEGNHSKGSLQLQREQHLEYQEELYVLSDKFFESSAGKWDSKVVIELISKFYVACPFDSNFPEIFEFTDRFYMTLAKLSSLGILDKAKKEIIFTFNALWKYFATYKAYNSLIELNRFENNKIILDFNLGNLLESRKTCFQESFQELYQVYWANLDKDLQFEYSEEVQKVREIMQDWTGED